jgi:hypothetical protein
MVEAARLAFGANLRSVVLYGSAAEGRMRATSDVNIAFVLRAFDPAQADALRAPLRTAQAAVQLRPMFLLEAEIAPVAAAFAQKFDDIGHRRQVLFGDDPFAGLRIPRAALRARLLQTTLNLTLRLRAGYVARGARHEQLALLVADAAGPLRSAAASLVELEGEAAASPKAALEKFAGSVGEPAGTLADLSQIRETRQAPPGVAVAVLFRLLDLAQKLHARAEKLA